MGDDITRSKELDNQNAPVRLEILDFGIGRARHVQVIGRKSTFNYNYGQL